MYIYQDSFHDYSCKRYYSADRSAVPWVYSCTVLDSASTIQLRAAVTTVVRFMYYRVRCTYSNFYTLTGRSHYFAQFLAVQLYQFPDSMFHPSNRFSRCLRNVALQLAGALLLQPAMARVGSNGAVRLRAMSAPLVFACTNQNGACSAPSATSQCKSATWASVRLRM